MIVGLSSSPASALEVGDTISIDLSSLEGSASDPILAAAVGAGSCVGTEACFQGPQNIGTNSCNGEQPCFQDSGDAGNDSCNGLKSCFQQSMEIGNDSCNGETACMQQGAIDPDPEAFGECPFDFPCGSVGNNSCNGLNACMQNHANVGNGSCNGEEVCRNQNTTVGICEFNSVSVEDCVGTVVPVVTITTPADDVEVDASVVAGFACKDTGGYALAGCTATLNGEAINNGDTIDTTTSGVKTLAVTGTDSSGNTVTSNLEVTVTAPEKPVDETPVVNPRILTGEFAASTGVKASVARLYIAVFQRQPDNAYWVERSAKEMTMWEIASYFVASDEFTLTYADLDNAAFIDLLYVNVMGRVKDADGAAYWTALLDGGVLDRGGITLQFSESAEFMNVTETT